MPRARQAALGILGVAPAIFFRDINAAARSARRALARASR